MYNYFKVIMLCFDKGSMARNLRLSTIFSHMFVNVTPEMYQYTGGHYSYVFFKDIKCGYCSCISFSIFQSIRFTVKIYTQVTIIQNLLNMKTESIIQRACVSDICSVSLQQQCHTIWRLLHVLLSLTT